VHTIADPSEPRRQWRSRFVAIAWVLSWPGVTGAIVGARSALFLPFKRLDLIRGEIEKSSMPLMQLSRGVICECHC
jgi:hypothetical protein